MTVVHVIWSAALGGIQRLVLDLAKEQVESGHQVSIVVCKQGGEMYSLFTSGSWDCISLSLTNAAIIRPNAIRKMIQVLRKTDILHLHEYVLNVDLATRYVRVPIVYTEHGLFASGRRLTLKDRLFRIPKSWFLRRRIDAWIANSEYSKSRIAEIYGTGHAVEVIYNGQAMQASENTPRIVDKEAFVVACIGRLAGVKRFDWVIRAFAQLERHPEDRLLVVGDGELKQELSDLSKVLGVESQVHFTGYIENVQDLLATVTIVAAPSVGEAFGLVALDAMAAAKPLVITEDGGGLVELVSGVLPQNIVRNTQQLKERLACYQRDRKQALNDGQLFAGELKKYTMRQTAEEYHRVYDKVSGRQKHAP